MAETMREQHLTRDKLKQQLRLGHMTQEEFDLINQLADADLHSVVALCEEDNNHLIGLGFIDGKTKQFTRWADPVRADIIGRLEELQWEREARVGTQRQAQPDIVLRNGERFSWRMGDVEFSGVHIEPKPVVRHSRKGWNPLTLKPAETGNE